jgi:hypothetical protein
MIAADGRGRPQPLACLAAAGILEQQHATQHDGGRASRQLWLGKRRHILTFFVVSAVSAVSSSLQSLAWAQ